jgi:hypothetical protein
MSAQRARKLSLNSKVSGTSLRWLVFRRGFLPSEVVSDFGAVLLVLSPLDKPIPQGAFVWGSLKESFRLMTHFGSVGLPQAEGISPTLPS